MTEQPHATAAEVAESVHEQDSHARGKTLVQGVGIAHIVVGSCLLLGGFFYTLAAVGPVLLQPWLKEGAARARRNNQTTVQTYQQMITTLEDQIARSEDEATIESLQANIEFYRTQIGRLLQEPTVAAMAALQTPLYWVCLAADIASGLALNLLLVISGRGLLRLREGSRRMAVWICGLKVARLAVVCVLFVFVLGPIWTLGWGLTIGESSSWNRPINSAGTESSRQAEAVIRSMTSATMTAMPGVLAVFLLAAAYPLLSGLALTRPEARDACKRTGDGTEQGLPRPKS